MLFSTIYASLFSVSGLVSGWQLDMPIGAMVDINLGSSFSLNFCLENNSTKKAGGTSLTKARKNILDILTNSDGP